MSRALGALASLLLVVVVGACGSDPPHRPFEAASRPAWYSLPTTTTTSPPVARVTARRPSRAVSRPRPAPSPGLDEATRQRVIAAIYSHPWNAALMLKVAGCESGLRPWARNGRFVGIFQIGGATPGLIEEHVDLAYSMWRSRGLAPWYPSRRCWG